MHRIVYCIKKNQTSSEIKFQQVEMIAFEHIIHPYRSHGVGASLSSFAPSARHLALTLPSCKSTLKGKVWNVLG